MRNLSAEITRHKTIRAVELKADNYTAIVAPSLGCNVLRFRDNGKNIEVFRYRDDATIAEIMNAPVIWGLQTLYLPNRFDGGVIKTSDAVYHLPVNEQALNNHIHGFIQTRSFNICDMGVKDDVAYVDSEYVYNEKDFFYNCFPVKFTVNIRIELSEKGLRHICTLTNNSDVMMPVSVATHTTINAPFVDNAEQKDIRAQIGIGEKVVMDESRWLPKEKFAVLDSYDMQYKNGTICPVLQDINNNMYTADYIDGKFHGAVFTDIASGKKICYETDENYKYWIIWNDRGFNNYFCPEPMTAQINAPNLSLPAEQTGYRELKPSEKFTAVQKFYTE